jgi:N-acetylglucosamine-6-sulfatase
VLLTHLIRRGLLLVPVVLAVVAVIAISSGPPARAGREVPQHAGQRPNIVLVLTDDLSMNLLPYMPHVQAMERSGLTFTNYFVSDSLCCPSRASILTGNFPHDTDVFINVGRQGGFNVFYGRGEERHTFAAALQAAGYRTALMGKYLNRYMQTRLVPSTYVPPGWSDWDVSGLGYGEFDYTLNENGDLANYGRRASDYLTDVLARKGVHFINRSASQGQPFFLELATFSPHLPYVPAPRDAHDYPGLQVPRTPVFDRLPTRPPLWLGGRQPLTRRQIREIDWVYRRRAEAVRSVDRMIARVESALQRDGIAGNSYLVFSSDNGLHTGEYRLMPGKTTAFDTDIHVPLVVVGPGVPAGASTDAMTENVDLAKTFAGLGGARAPGDGHSLVPLLHGGDPRGWRSAILVEHHGRDMSGGDPDFQKSAAGAPRTYEAMRTRRFLYVEYNDGEREFYDVGNDPFELHNLAYRLSTDQLAQLHSELAAMENCHNGPSCWRAMHVSRWPTAGGAGAIK